MLGKEWLQWLKQTFRLSQKNKPCNKRPRPRYRPVLEHLEDRVVPTGTLSVLSTAYGTPLQVAYGQSEINPYSAVSANGQYTVYTSAASNLTSTNQASNELNIYLFNQQGNGGAGSTTLISQAAGQPGVEANGTSFNAAISGDGSTVAFYSTATNLVAGESVPGGSVELYLYNTSTGTITLASAAYGSSATAPTGSNGENPAIPPSGGSEHWLNTLGYSAGSALLDEDINGLAMPSLSYNGQYIAYIDDATDLGAANNGATYSGYQLTNVFLYDNNPADGAAFGTNTLVSHAAGEATTSANGPNGAWATTAAMSADGSTVAFTDPGTNLVSGESGGTNGIGVSDELYVYGTGVGSAYSGTSIDTATGLSAGQTVLASHAAGSNLTGASIPNNLADGLLGDGYSEDSPPTLSNNGAEVAYYYAGDNLVSGQPTTGASVLNVFLYNAAANTNTLVTHVAGSPATPGNNPQNQVADPGTGPVEATGPLITGDGQYIAYANNSDNLIVSAGWTGNVTGTSEVTGGLVIDTTSSTANLTNGEWIKVSSLTGMTSATGTFQISNITSTSFELVGDAGTGTYTGSGGTWIYGGSDEVYLYNVSTGTNTLVSHAAGSTTAPDAGGGTAPSISGIDSTTYDSSATDNYVSFMDLAIPATGSLTGAAGANSGYTGSITGATSVAGSPIIITTASTANLITGEFVTIASVGGETSADGTWSITVDSPTTFTLNNSTGGSSYTSGGTWTYGVVNVRLYNSQAAPTAQPTIIGQSFDTTPIPPLTGTGANTPATLEFYASALAPTVMSADGSTIDFDGTANPAPQTSPSVANTYLNLNVYQYSTNSSSSGQTPVITSSNTLTLTTGTQTPFTITATNSPTSFSLTPTPMPAGLTFNTTTGILTGIPTTSGTYTLTATATNSTGTSTPQALTVTINPGLPTGIALTNTTVTAAQPLGTAIGTLSTTDPNANQAFTYSILTTGTPFAITGNTLTTNTVIQTTTVQTYAIQIQTTDSLGLTYTQSFTITVDPSTSPPTDITLSNGTVTAYQPLGTTVGTISSTDPNVGQTETYTLTGLNANLFTISNSGQLLTSTVFSTNTQQTYGITVVATDAPAGLSSSQNFTITVNPSTSPPTSIALSNSTVTAYQPSGAAVGTLSTTDPNAGQAFTYTLLTTGTPFTITGNTLTTTGVIPTTTTQTYTVQIQTTDSANLSYTQSFTITVNPSTTPPTSIALSNSTVTAYQPSGTTVGTLSTTDPNAGQTFTYTLLTTGTPFTINGNTLTTNNVIPTATTQTYTVQIQTTDSANLSYTQSFTITVNPSTAPPTNIALSNSTVTAYQPSGTTVGTLSTTDPNAGQAFTYTLLTTGTPFTITGNTLTTTGVIATTTTQTYTVQIQTTDSANLSYTQTFTITVNPSTAPPTSIALSNSTVTAYEPSGTTVGTLSSTDPNAGQTFTYTLLTTGTPFTITGNTLTTTGVIATTTTQTYTVQIQTTDSANLSYTQTFTITVNPSTTPPTSIALSNSTVTAYEPSGATVGTLSSTDPNAGQTFTYTLLTTGTPFTITGNTLATTGVIATTTTQTYTVQIQTTDSANLSYTQTFTITVNPSTAPPTNIALSNSTVTAYQPSGTTVGTLSSTDPNAGQTFTYTLLTTGTPFTINGNTLTTTGVIATTTTQTYTVQIQTTDSLGLTYTQSFTITVNPSTAPPTNITLSTSTVTAYQPVGATVGTVSSSDPNVGQTESYTLTGMNANLFTINSSGQLLTNTVFSTNTQETYTITVMATDAPAGLSSSQTFTITVNPSTAPPTNIALSNSTVTAYEPSGTTVGTLTTTDPNADQTFTYTLLTTGTPFAITGNTLTTNSVIPTAATQTYTVQIQTTDSANLSYTQSFTITVNPSTAPPTSIALSNSTVTAYQPSGATVGTLTTTDPNADQAFTYTLLTTGTPFTIAGDSLATDSVIQTTTTQTYTVQIQTTDSANLSYTQSFTITVNPSSSPPTDITLSNSTVTAYQPSGTPVGTLSSSEPDVGQTVSYTLTGTNANLFTIDSTGDLLTNSVFSTNTQQTYNITVVATDAPAGLSSSQNFTITVNPSTSPPTDITLSTSTTMAYQTSGTLVGTLSSTDPNVGQTVSYALTGSNANLFTINSAGQLLTNSVFNSKTTEPISITVVATDSPADLSSSQTFTLGVTSAAFTSPTTAALLEGQPGSITIQTSGAPTAVLSVVGALPSFLTFTDNGDGTATLSGTPTSAGTSTIKLSASNSAGVATQTLTVTVYQPPSLAVSGNTTFVVGQANTVTLTASAGSPAATEFSFSGTLPKGVIFTANKNGTATLSGTPQAGSVGSYSITVTANNGPAGTTLSQTVQTVSVTVDQKPAFTSPTTAALLEGQSGSITIQTSGAPTAALSVVGTLPSFLTFTDNGDGTATLSGTPTSVGVSTIELSASNSAGTATQTLTLTVDQPPSLAVSGNTTFVVGEANTVTLTASAGSPAATVFSFSGTLPKGVIFTANKNGTATLSGTPQAGSFGVYSITVTGNNGPAGTTLSQTSQTVSLTVDQKPAFTSPTTAALLEGQPGSITIQTSGTPTAVLGVVGALPSFLTFTDNGNGTATLSGTPTSVGTSTIELSASNSAGTATQTLTVTVDQPPPLAVSGSTTLVVGQANTVTLTASGASPTATVFSYSGTLPKGVTFTSNKNGTATLSGTPQAGSVGSYSITVIANNGPAGTTLSQTSQTVSLTVDQKPAFTSPTTAALLEGQSGSITIQTNGTPTAVLGVVGALPSFLTFTDNGNGTATLSGTPTSVGTSTIELSARNSAGTAIQTLTLTVDQPPSLAVSGNATFVVGQANTLTLRASDGSPTATVLSYSGTLPKGVTFTANKNGTATLGGTPQAGSVGSYSITFTANNGAVGTTLSETSQTVSLTVDQKPAFTSPTTAALLEGQSGSITIQTNGTPTAVLGVVGALPSFLTFTDNGNGTATLSGTPTSVGTSTIKLSAGSSAGVATQTLTLTVDQPPSLAVSGNTTFVVGQANTVTLRASAGSPAATAFSFSGTLPKGVIFTANKNGTATLSGTPKAGSVGVYSITVTANNGPVGTTLFETSQTVSLTVDQKPAFTSPTTAALLEGQSGSITIQTSGTPTAVLGVVGALPSFLTFTDNGNGTATLSGTPTSVGTSTIKLSAGSSAGVATQTLTLTVDQPPSLAVSGNTTFVVGQANTVTLRASEGSPAATAFSFSGTLPKGVIFTANKNGTATLSGTPKAGSVGVYSITVTANNGPVGTTLSETSQTVSLTVDQKPAFTSTTTAALLEGQPGSITIQTSGTPTAALSVVGAVPSFLTFTDNGDGTATLSGTPTSVGTSTIKLSAGSSAGVATQTLTLTVDQPPSLAVSGNTTFVVGQANTVTLRASEGSPAATVFSFSGTLPKGVTFTANKNGTATLSGTPQAGSIGSYSVTVTANNGPAGTTLSQTSETFTLTVYQPPVFTNSESATFVVGQSGSFAIATTGSPTSLSASALPAGLSFTDNGNGTASINGTPQAGTAGSYTITLTADGLGVPVTQTLTLIIINQVFA